MAVKSLNTFFQTLIEKNARLKHQFQMYVTTGVGSIDEAFKDITLWAKGTAVPSLTQQTTEFPYLGVKFQIPTTFQFTQEISLDIVNDSANTIRNGMLEWFNLVSNTKIMDGGSGEGIKTLPATSFIRLELYKPDLKTIVETYKLFGVFPAEIGELAVSNETPELSTFTAKFHYQFYELETA